MFKKGDKIKTPRGISIFDRYDSDGDIRCVGGGCFAQESCVKVEPNETEKSPIPKLRDVPHAEVMYRWLTEPDSVVQFSVLENVWNDVTLIPSWESDIKYRIKPETVMKYQWAISGNSGIWVSASHYKDEEELFKSIGSETVKWVQRLDQTAKEFEFTDN
ncbi:MAG TPA: hypothetical protein VFM18_13820 [Methanosarcina sp.]|nr:hypothetical protein [Methanosarcina sp.]